MGKISDGKSGSWGVIGDVEFELSEPYSLDTLKDLQSEEHFVGRQSELRICRAAWGLDREGRDFRANAIPMHFRLEGPPGVGKNALVYLMAIRLNRPLYVIQGHEEVAPEDLALSLIPTKDKDSPFVLRAGPLASAIYRGGLVFFDEINRVPQKALAQLASVLDSRKSIFSSMANVWIKQDPSLQSDGFRFCCALNSNTPDAGALPDYVDERTLPRIYVDHLPLKEMLEVIEKVVQPPKAALDAYRQWLLELVERNITPSARTGISVMRLAVALLKGRDARNPEEAVSMASELVLKKKTTSEA